MLPDEFQEVLSLCNTIRQDSLNVWGPVSFQLWLWYGTPSMGPTDELLWRAISVTHQELEAAFDLVVALAERVSQMEVPEVTPLTDAQIFDACYRELVRRWGPAGVT